ncbi:MAG: hypothetical protein FJX52_07865, partial [Alphaproteobacteria bacterium]|nr:hypothetical protein [Alphaproteobacteria bacterium]
MTNADAPIESGWRRTLAGIVDPALLRRLFANRSFAIGFTLFGTVVLVAIFADVLAPHDPVQNNYRYRLGPPNEAHLLGTDNFGRDILSRVLHGSRVSLAI